MNDLCSELKILSPTGERLDEDGRLSAFPGENFCIDADGDLRVHIRQGELDLTYHARQNPPPTFIAGAGDLFVDLIDQKFVDRGVEDVYAARYHYQSIW